MAMSSSMVVSADDFDGMMFRISVKDTFYVEAFGRTYDYRHHLRRWGFRFDRKSKTWLRSYFTPVRYYMREDRAFNDIVVKLDRERKRIMKEAVKKIESVLYYPENFDLREYQLAGAALSVINMTYLLAYDMGLGKTITSLTAAFTVQHMMQQSGKEGKVIYICPAYLRFNVYREVVKAGKTAAIYPKAPKPYKHVATPLIAKEDVVIMSYEGVNRLVSEMDVTKLFLGGLFGSVIIDECHYIKNYKSKRTKSVVKVAGIAKQFKRMVLFLTGTPILNRPNELYTVFSFLFPGAESYTSFTKRYNGGRMGRFGWQLGKPINLKELHLRMAPKMHRKTKEEVLKELPPLMRIVTRVDKVKFPDKGLLVSGIAGLQKYKWELAMNKVDSTVDILYEATPCLVFTDYRQPAVEIFKKANKRGVKTGLITGKMSQKKRQLMVDAFQAGKLDALVIVTSAGSQGLNLQRAKTVVFNDLPYSPGLLVQAESRAHRMGNDNKVISVLVVAENNPFDETLVKYLEEKINVITKVADGLMHDVKLSDSEVRVASMNFHQYLKKVQGDV